MKHICVVVAFLFVASSLVTAPAYAETRSESTNYPVSIDSELLEKSPSDTESMVSVEVKIEEILPGAFGKPYLRAIFADGKGPLWIAPLVNPNNSIKSGDVVRVRGYWAALKGDEPAHIAEANHSGQHLLAVCYYNFRTKQGLFFPFKKEPNDCSRWRDGL